MCQALDSTLGIQRSKPRLLAQTSELCNTELHPSVQGGKARLGEGVRDEWGLEVRYFSPVGSFLASPPLSVAQELGGAGSEAISCIAYGNLKLPLAWAKTLIFQSPLVQYRKSEITIAFSSLKKQL